MSSSLPSPDSGPVAFVIRRASAGEIDTLCTIDTDATSLFERVGLSLNLPADHEFSVAERTRWQRCLSAGSTLLAVDLAGEPIGFAAAGTLDGRPYLDQLSVRGAYMRLGVGSALLRAIEQATRNTGGRTLWLMTYGHLPWNRPFYERNGFAAVPETECGPEMAAEMRYQRRWLPLPEQRVVMRKALVP